MIDHSINEAVSGNWQADAEKRIKKSKVLLVMVGSHTHSAQGVRKEVLLAKRYGKKIVPFLGSTDSNVRPVADAGSLYRMELGKFTAHSSILKIFVK